MRGVSACLVRGDVLDYLNAFLGNLLKTCLGNLLKTCLGNSLNTAKHVSLSICPLSAFLRFASLRVAACRLAVLFRLRFELVKTARFSDSVSSRLAPRPVMRHASRPPVFPSVGACRSSPSASARPRFSPIEPPLSDAPPNRHARRGEKRGEGRGEDGCLTDPCYMNSCCVIYSAFLLYISCSCYISGVFVICRAFLLYISHFCYISRVLVICPAFLLYLSFHLACRSVLPLLFVI